MLSLAIFGATGRMGQALLRLADFEEGIVLPHEFTMPGPKRDRLLLTRAVRANLEPLFFTYEDRSGRLDKIFDEAQQGQVLASGSGPDGTGLRLFSTAQAGAIAEVQHFFATLPVIIADGHHRYETMLNYRNECREARDGNADAAHEFVLAYLVNAFDPGTEIRAIHRVLNGDVADFVPVLTRAGFELQACPADIDGNGLIRALARHSEESHVFAFANASRGAQLALKARSARLDVELLHDELLPALGGDLSFDAQPLRLLANARSGEIELAIAMNPIAPADLFRVVQAGERLPKKSTFFTPKVPSGLVIRDFQ